MHESELEADKAGLARQEPPQLKLLGAKVKGPMFGHRRRFGLGLAIVVSILAGGCSGGQPSAEIQPAGEISAGATARVPPAPQIREVYRFHSLPVMVATSDAVVLATVTDVQNGRTVGEASDTLTFVELRMRVDESLFR